MVQRRREIHGCRGNADFDLRKRNRGILLHGAGQGKRRLLRDRQSIRRRAVCGDSCAGSVYDPEGNGICRCADDNPGRTETLFLGLAPERRTGTEAL